MLVLNTVDDRRRRIRRAGWTALLGVLLTLGSASAWWACRGGEPVDTVAGVEMPPGTRLVYTERREPAEGDTAAAYEGIYLTAAVPVSELEEHFAPLSTRAPESRRFFLPDGTIITISPSFEVPATRLNPVREVTPEIPLGARSWIVIEHGEPPETTSNVAVAPLGAS